MHDVITKPGTSSAYSKVVEYVVKVSAISVDEVVTILHGQQRFI